MCIRFSDFYNDFNEHYCFYKLQTPIYWPSFPVEINTVTQLSRLTESEIRRVFAWAGYTHRKYATDHLTR